MRPVSIAKSSPVSEAYVEHRRSLNRYIRKFLRDPADIEDIAQEAYLRARAAELGRPIEQPKSFLFCIAKNLSLSALTRKARQITDYIEDLGDSAVIPVEDSAEDETSRWQVLGLNCEAVALLSPQRRQVYLLRKVHGFSHQEIGRQLGITVSTVEKHLLKALQQCDRYVRERTELPPNGQ